MSYIKNRFKNRYYFFSYPD